MGVMDEDGGERLFFAEGMIGGAFVAGFIFQIIVIPLLLPGGGGATEISAVDAVLAGVVSKLWIALVAVVVVLAVIATVLAGVNGAVGVGAAIVGGAAATRVPFLAVILLLAAWWTGYDGYRKLHTR